MTLTLETSYWDMIAKAQATKANLDQQEHTKLQKLHNQQDGKANYGME